MARYPRTLLFPIALLLLMLGYHGGRCASPKAHFLGRDAIPIDSIDPSDADFADLQSLDPIFSSHRIILLGESDHGDGATFLAKTRLIKYLHERHHFDLLVFESNLLQCYLGWQMMCEQGQGRAGFKRGVFGVWSLSRQLAPLIDYLQAQARGPEELELAGMGITSSSLAPTEDVERFCSTLGENAPNEFEAGLIRKMILWLNGDKGIREDVAEWLPCIERVNCALSRIDVSQLTNPREFLIWRRFFEQLPLALQRQKMVLLRQTIAAVDLSDRLSAENLRWMVETLYPTKKVIVWAASFHIAKQDKAGCVVEGVHIAKMFPGSAYAIAFTSADGQYARPFRSVVDVQPPMAGSLEEAFSATGREYGFLDFKSAIPHQPWLAGDLWARLCNYQYEHLAWAKYYDGVFFIKTMKPNEFQPW